MSDDFSSIRGGSFEAAVRAKLGVGEDFQVSVEPSGGGDYQLGDETWDSEPYSFSVIAQPMRWTESPARGITVLVGDVSRYAQRREVEFDSVPAIWEWLAESDQPDNPQATDQ